MIETSFEIIESADHEHGSRGYHYQIIQRKRTVYYEDVVNPNKYRDSIVCTCKKKEVAEKLLVIFNEIPFTTEFMSEYRDKFYRKERLSISTKGELSLQGNRSYNGRCNLYELFHKGESLVSCEEDFYNGTDQSMVFSQLIPDKKNKFNAYTMQEICRFWNSDYLPIVVEEWCIKHKTAFYENEN